ncbi:MAG: hypothetical protein ABI591_15190, partial [Kofleriaceae bacterium]
MRTLATLKFHTVPNPYMIERRELLPWFAPPHPRVVRYTDVMRFTLVAILLVSANARADDCDITD